MSDFEAATPLPDRGHPDGVSLRGPVRVPTPDDACGVPRRLLDQVGLHGHPLQAGVTVQHCLSRKVVLWFGNIATLLQLLSLFMEHRGRGNKKLAIKNVCYIFHLHRFSTTPYILYWPVTPALTATH